MAIEIRFNDYLLFVAFQMALFHSMRTYIYTHAHTLSLSRSLYIAYGIGVYGSMNLG